LSVIETFEWPGISLITVGLMPRPGSKVVAACRGSWTRMAGKPDRLSRAWDEERGTRLPPNGSPRGGGGHNRIIVDPRVASAQVPFGLACVVRGGWRAWWLACVVAGVRGGRRAWWPAMLDTRRSRCVSEERVTQRAAQR